LSRPSERRTVSMTRVSRILITYQDFGPLFDHLDRDLLGHGGLALRSIYHSGPPSPSFSMMPQSSSLSSGDR